MNLRNSPSDNKDLIAIGDIQGCLESLEDLLEQLPTDAHLVFVGDIVNRGPDSLGALRRVKQLCDSGRASAVLGNHDLHLLAVAAGGAEMKRRDTIAPILSAPDRQELIDWLRTRPLLIDTPDTVFVHAGVPPSWSLELALKLSDAVHKKLRGDNWKKYLENLYGNESFSPSLRDKKRFRAVVNSLTRMRFLKPDGTLDFDIRERLINIPEGFSPWFDRPHKIEKTICFGHWSVLGLLLRPNLVAIDTGCLWGGQLTAIRLRDRRLFQENCPCWRAPKAD